jgi:hypothetical protein
MKRIGSPFGNRSTAVSSGTGTGTARASAAAAARILRSIPTLAASERDPGGIEKGR